MRFLTRALLSKHRSVSHERLFLPRIHMLSPQSRSVMDARSTLPTAPSFQAVLVIRLGILRIYESAV